MSSEAALTAAEKAALVQRYGVVSELTPLPRPQVDGEETYTHEDDAMLYEDEYDDTYDDLGATGALEPSLEEVSHQRGETPYVYKWGYYHTVTHYHTLSHVIASTRRHRLSY